MARVGAAVEKMKDFWDSQVNDEEKWAVNSEVILLLLRAPFLFAKKTRWAIFLFLAVLLGGEFVFG